MDSKTFDIDYIIVGGGLSGCVVASRLHRGNPSLRVLLIEAGSDSSGHPLTSAPFGMYASRASELDWSYPIVPQPCLDGRQYPLPAGKVLSGGTALNAAAWTRGSKTDYDRWAEIVGDKRWSYEGLLPYFRKTERHWDPDADHIQHGFDGPVHITSVSASDPERRYPLKEPLRAAWNRVGVKYISDGNNGSPLGLFEIIENWRDGKRQNVRDAYDLDGVQLLLNSTVRRVLFEKRNTRWIAVGVQLVSGDRIMAQKEVILAAGAIATPKIMMLSGIGPATELERHCIPVVRDSPGVGQNFHDHLSTRQWWKLRNPSAGLAMGSPSWTNPAYGKGIPCDWYACQQTPSTYLRSALDIDENSSNGDHHLLHPECYHTETIIFYSPAGADKAGLQIPFDGTHITSIVIGMLPTSRGTVKLASADPLDMPLVDPNGYATEVDRCSMRDGIRQVLRAMLETPEGRGLVEDTISPQGYSKLTPTSPDAEIDAYIRRVAATTFHYGGTAAMGDVVDSNLKVLGIDGLRVVDASVLPVPIAAHYQVPLYALAEQAAEIILAAS